jgi:hypothetical protein
VAVGCANVGSGVRASATNCPAILLGQPLRVRYHLHIPRVLRPLSKRSEHEDPIHDLGLMQPSLRFNFHISQPFSILGQSPYRVSKVTVRSLLRCGGPSSMQSKKVKLRAGRSTSMCHAHKTLHLQSNPELCSKINTRLPLPRN